jgi:hypothetical protein
MAKSIKTKDSYSVSFTLRDYNTSDDIMRVSMDWENRSPEEVKNNLNKWLVSIDIPLEVVDKTDKK